LGIVIDSDTKRRIFIIELFKATGTPSASYVLAGLILTDMTGSGRKTCYSAEFIAAVGRNPSTGGRLNGHDLAGSEAVISSHIVRCMH
jgi:hypothetical protein